MKTYTVNNIVNIPFMKGCFESVKNESRVNQALAVYNQVENLGIAFDAALYKKVAKYFVNSDKAVMMAFAEYQAKNAEPAELKGIDADLAAVAECADLTSRSAKMKEIFSICAANGITEPKEMRARCEKALNYHNTGRIWNTWKEWSDARTKAEKERKAAERKAKRAATIAAKKAAAPEPKPTRIVFNVSEPETETAPAPTLSGNDIFFDVHFKTKEIGDIEEFFAKYNDFVVKYAKNPYAYTKKQLKNAQLPFGAGVYCFRIHANDNVFDEIINNYSEDENIFRLYAVRNRYYIEIENVTEQESESTADIERELNKRIQTFLNAAKRSPKAPTTKALKSMMKVSKLVIA